MKCDTTFQYFWIFHTIIAVKGHNQVAIWSYAFLGVWYSMPIVMETSRKHHFEQVWVCIYGNDLCGNWKLSMPVRFSIFHFTNAIVIIIMQIKIITSIINTFNTIRFSASTATSTHVEKCQRNFDFFLRFSNNHADLQSDLFNLNMFPLITYFAAVILIQGTVFTCENSFFANISTSCQPSYNLSPIQVWHYSPELLELLKLCWASFIWTES